MPLDAGGYRKHRLALRGLDELFRYESRLQESRKFWTRLGVLAGSNSNHTGRRLPARSIVLLFCDEMLERYRDVERVKMISGENRQCGNRRSPASYFFGRIIHFWGWATWRRAWAQNDKEMTDWPILRETDWLEKFLNNEGAVARWRWAFDMVYHRRASYWSAAWTYSIWRQNGVSVMPESNLVTNIGFGLDGTITKDMRSRSSLIPLVEISFPLRHPVEIVPLQAADDFTFKVYFAVPEPTRFSTVA